MTHLPRAVSWLQIIHVVRRETALQTELSSFLVEITALIFKKKDEDGSSYILDSILDKTGMKGTGMACIQPLNFGSVLDGFLFSGDYL